MTFDIPDSVYKELGYGDTHETLAFINKLMNEINRLEFIQWNDRLYIKELEENSE